MNVQLTAAVDALRQLEAQVKKGDILGSATVLRTQTDVVVKDLQALVESMQKGELVLEKEEIVLLMSALENALSLLNKEAEESKGKLKKAQTAAQAHKLYSGQ